MNTEKKVFPNLADAGSASIRQQKIIELVNQGKLDPEEGGILFEATTRPDQIEADRNSGSKRLDDTPIGRLITLLYKLPGNPGK